MNGGVTTCASTLKTEEKVGKQSEVGLFAHGACLHQHSGAIVRGFRL